MMSSGAARAGLRASAQLSSICRNTAFSGMRGYAAAAAPTQNVIPPVALFGVDGTYANALYTASAKTSSLEQTARALATLSDVFKRDPKLAVILRAPTLTVGDKSQIAQELLRVAGGPGKDGILQNFLNTLAENNRLSVLEGVCEKFTMLMGAHRGEIELIITSAQELDRRTLQRLEAAVSKSEYSQGKKLKVVAKVNPDIVGGLVVEIGDRTIDLSVSSKIAKLNKALTDTL